MLAKTRYSRISGLLLVASALFLTLTGFSGKPIPANGGLGYKGTRPDSVLITHATLKGHPIGRSGNALSGPGGTPGDICDLYITVHKVCASELSAATSVYNCGDTLAVVGFSTKAQQCPLAFGSTCLLPWSDKSGIKTCEDEAVTQARCPSSGYFEFGGASSGQLWRAFSEVCATFADDTYGCSDVAQTVQF